MVELLDNTPPEYLRRVNAALALRDVPDFPAALDQLQKAVTQAPNDWSIHLLLGMTYQEMEQPQAAEKSFQSALSLRPESEQIYQAYGTFLFEQGHLQEAAKFLKHLVEVDVGIPKVWQLYATLLRDLQKVDESLQILRSAHVKWPEDVNFANQLGHLLLANDHPEEAKPVLEKALALKTSTGVLCDLATVYTMSGDFNKALSFLEQAVQRRPENSRAWRGISYCYLQQEKYNEALDAAEKALDFDRSHFRSWQIMADVLLSLNRHEKALEVLEEGIRLASEAPDGQIVWEHLVISRVRALANIEGPEIAIKQIEQDLESGRPLGDWPELLHLKINFLLTIGRFEESLATLLKFAESEPNDAIPLLQEIGYKLYFSGEVNAAYSYFDALLKLIPDHPEFLNNLGFLLAGQEKWKQAAEMLQKALSISSDNSKLTQANLGYVYLRQKKYQEATHLMEELLPQIEVEDQHVVRVACWHDGDFITPLPDVYPISAIPLDLAVRANLALAYFLSSDTEKGLDIAQEAVDRAPQNYIGYITLGCLQIAQGNSVKAQKSLEKGLSLAVEDEVAKSIFEKLLA